MAVWELSLDLSHLQNADLARDRLQNLLLNRIYVLFLVGGLEFNASLAPQVVTPLQVPEELYVFSCTFYPLLVEPIY